MISLLATMITAVGPAGIGSALKMIASALDRRAERALEKQKQETINALKNRELDIEWAKIMFGSNPEHQAYSRGTRRILAVGGMLTLAAIAIICTIYPSVPLVTFVPPEHQREISLLWGFVSFPVTRDMVVTITTGHLALMSVSIYSMVFGFYFTPGGSK